MVSEPLFSMYVVVVEFVSAELEEQAVSKKRERTKEMISRFIEANYKAFVYAERKIHAATIQGLLR